MGRPAIIEPIPTPLPDEELIARIFRGLGDASRIKILKTLLDGPKTQGDIVTAVELSQGRVSQHLSCLVWCGYLSSERHGRSVVYEIANPRVTALLDIGAGFLDSTTGDISSCRIIAPDGSRSTE
jgi:ArsR family transcriptional regulator